jgi:hypothetical protein
MSISVLLLSLSNTSVNTRNMDHLHRPTAKLSCFQKCAHCAGIKIFNSLPSNLRSLMNKKAQFKVALKRYLNTHSFYPVEEFLTFKMTHGMCKSFFPPVVWTLHNMRILYVKLLCVCSQSFEKSISVISLFCLWMVFVLLLLHLSVCYVSLWLTLYPIVVITNLRIHGMYVLITWAGHVAHTV